MVIATGTGLNHYVAVLAVRGKSNMAANFTWPDEEINLLLDVVIDYKAGKAGEAVDWETVRSKYEDMSTKLFLEKYPENDKEKTSIKTESKTNLNLTKCNKLGTKCCIFCYAARQNITIFQAVTALSGQKVARFGCLHESGRNVEPCRSKS